MTAPAFIYTSEPWGRPFLWAAYFRAPAFTRERMSAGHLPQSLFQLANPSSILPLEHACHGVVDVLFRRRNARQPFNDTACRLFRY